jgi:hypothetical protein
MDTERDRSPTPDLFSPLSGRDPSAQSANLPPTSPAITHATDASSARRHVLPNDLPNAIKQLDDLEFDRLVTAVVTEQNRRGRKPPVPNKRKHRDDIAPTPLTRGQLNAVRAAFKAGITPSRIARQFGVSQANVRKGLANDKSK